MQPPPGQPPDPFAGAPQSPGRPPGYAPQPPGYGGFQGGPIYQQQGLPPHRGTLILVLGILALMFCQPIGIAAWVMANTDLRLMDSGHMDPSGRELTKVGKILGMVAIGFVALGLLLGLAFVGLMAAGVLAGMS